MVWSDLMNALTLWDGLALTLIVACWALIGWVIEHPPAGRPSVSALMERVQRDWMAAFAAREVRIFDAQIITSLRQGASFYASTCLIAVGGVLALIGNTAPLETLASEIGTGVATPLLWQIRLAPVALFLMHAFLKFVWSHRLFGYSSVALAAVPDAGHADCGALAARAGGLNIRATVHFNAGLRSMFFALGALGWLVGPVGLVVGTLAVTWLLWAREFWSRPRDILLGK
jgi:uncharacterized membrane protein